MFGVKTFCRRALHWLKVMNHVCFVCDIMFLKEPV